MASRPAPGGGFMGGGMGGADGWRRRVPALGGGDRGRGRRRRLAVPGDRVAVRPARQRRHSRRPGDDPGPRRERGPELLRRRRRRSGRHRPADFSGGSLDPSGGGGSQDQDFSGGDPGGGQDYAGGSFDPAAARTRILAAARTRISAAAISAAATATSAEPVHFACPVSPSPRKRGEGRAEEPA